MVLIKDVVLTMPLINTRIKVEVIKMEANINVNIRMNRELKKQFEAFCDEVGINMTTAFTMFVKKRLESIEFLSMLVMIERRIKKY